MQTNDITPPNASPVKLESRFNAVRSFLIDRGVRNYMSVFMAFGLDVEDRKDDITAWWNSRVRITANDEPLLSKMESVVETLKNETLNEQRA